MGWNPFENISSVCGFIIAVISGIKTVRSVWIWCRKMRNLGERRRVGAQLFRLANKFRFRRTKAPTLSPIQVLPPIHAPRETQGTDGDGTPLEELRAGDDAV